MVMNQTPAFGKLLFKHLIRAERENRFQFISCIDQYKEVYYHSAFQKVPLCYQFHANIAVVWGNFFFFFSRNHLSLTPVHSARQSLVMQIRSPR